MNLQDKKAALYAILKDLGAVAVAFSGGVDSTYLLEAARLCLGDANVIAVTASSGSFPAREMHEAEDFCKEHKIRQFVSVTEEMRIPGFSENPPERCYLCKKAIFTGLMDIAARQGFHTVCEGTNTDDEGDYRPGMAAIKELGVRSPLREARLSKQDIRDLSLELGLPTWSKPSYACLATRFPYGEQITPEKLRMVEQAEQFLYDKGFPQVRVRIHGNLARIETLPKDMDRLFSLRDEVHAALQEFGFRYVSLDLKGYRTGSMNEALPDEQRFKA